MYDLATWGRQGRNYEVRYQGGRWQFVAALASAGQKNDYSEYLKFLYHSRSYSSLCPLPIPVQVQLKAFGT